MLIKAVVAILLGIAAYLLSSLVFNHVVSLVIGIVVGVIAFKYEP